MAMRKTTLLDAALFIALRDVDFKDDDGNVKKLVNIELQLKARRAMCEFDNGDKHPIGIFDTIEMDLANITYPVSNTESDAPIKPNKPRLKNKKKD